VRLGGVNQFSQKIGDMGGVMGGEAEQGTSSFFP
jgi:hypothetical protein